MLWAVIMAGGKGERFWPRSRARHPKQLLPITGAKSMVRLTLERLDGLVCTENILVLTNAEQLEAMRTELPLLRPENIIAEPALRDTAPCIGLAATLIEARDPDAVMLVLPADHVITPCKVFQEAMKTLCDAAAKTPILFTCGIPPQYPATGFGYLETGGPLPDISDKLLAVNRFVEKPDTATAEKYCAKGNYFWNSGIFVWRASVILKNIQASMPELALGLKKIKEESERSSLDNALQQIFPGLPRLSIDYGVMEKAQQVAMLPAPFTWDDVGSWDAIGKHFTADDQGNICVGQTVLIDCQDMLVYNLSSNENLIATAVGLKNQILVQTEDAILSCSRGDAQRVKEIVTQLKEKGLDQYL